MTTPFKPNEPSFGDLTLYRALTEAATPGPWNLAADGQSITQTSHITRDVWTIPRTMDDMAFIAESRTMIPALLGEVDRLNERLASMDALACRTVAQLQTAHDTLKEAVAKAIEAGPPTDDGEEGSVSHFSCCGGLDYHPHRAGCWWQALITASQSTP